MCLSALGLGWLCAPAAEAQPVAGAWTSIGGSPIHNGQVSISPRDPVAGAVEVVVQDPGDPRTLWIGTVNGGVFRTTQADQAFPRWTSLTDDQGALSVSALDLDPTAAGSTTLVLGVGSTSSYEVSSPLRGLFRSTDQGDNWTSLDSEMVGKNIKAVAARGQTLLACVDGADSGIVDDTGLYRSTDGGNDFERLDDPGSGVPATAFCIAMAGDPNDPTRLFAALVDVDGDDHGVYVSTSSGAGWTRITPTLTNTHRLLANATSVELAVGAGGQALFVAICEAGRLAEITRTLDDGATWTLLGRPLSLEDAIFGAHPGGQCGIHFSLAAHPTDPDVFFVGGDRQPSATETEVDPTFPNSIGADDFGARLFRGELTPQGTRWTSLAYCPPPPGQTSSLCGIGSPSDSSAPHADSRHMLITAAGELLETDDGGIYLHSQPNGTNGRWRSLNGDLSLNEQHDIAYDPITDTVAVGNQDNGTARQINTNNPTWSMFFSGDGGDVAIAANDPMPGISTRYFSGQLLQGAVRAQFDANNQLVPQSVLELSLYPLDQIDIEPQFVTPTVVHGLDPTRLIFGGKNGVFESFDRGDSTRQISPETVSTSGGRAICYGHASNPEVLYFGTNDGVFSRRSASSAPSRSASYPGQDAVGCSLDPNDAQRVFMVGASGVFESLDGAVTWQDRSGNLLGLDPGELRSIAVIPGAGAGNSDRVVVGGGEGVYIAFESEGFAIWRPLGSGLPPAPVFELIYDLNDDILIAGTLGRGAHAFNGIRTSRPPTP